MTKPVSLPAACLSLSLFSLLCLSAAPVSAAAWDLVWSDEFDKPGALDTSKWAIQVGPSTVNGELEYYSNRLENIKVADGYLNIIARKENFGGRNYTSGRINTEGKAWWTYGKFEIKAKLPQGKGSWPAFWMLGHECDKHGGWPACGEIDIAEYAGKNPNVVNTTMHMKDINYMLKNNPHGSATLTDVGANFHVYTLEWYKDHMDFFMDSVKVMTFKDPGKGAGSWPYFNPQYIILNEAIGGGYAGPVDDKIFPTQWTIDYVRVYKQGTPTEVLRPVTGRSPSVPAILEGAVRYEVDGKKLASKRNRALIPTVTKGR
jgi:beta-glucanase (GH16 family)